MSESPLLLAGKYRFLRPLASGGMGTVLVYEHQELGMEVAIKRLDASRDRADQLARFRREGTALALLKSRNIVQVFDMGEDEQGPYLVMELLEGEDLAARLRSTGPLALDEAIAYFEQTCKAISLAHQAGLVHRDIKPSNVFLAQEPGEDAPVVKVLDFGIARPLAFGDDATLTATGHFIGSPGYMSPEQIRGQTVDARSDVWALVALLYEMLAGQSAFGSHVGDALANICQGTFRPLSDLRPELSALDAVVTRGLAVHPADRYPNVPALLEAVRSITKSLTNAAEQRISSAPSTFQGPHGKTAEGTLSRAGQPARLQDGTSTLDAVAAESSRGRALAEGARHETRRPSLGVPVLLGVLVVGGLAAAWTLMRAPEGSEASEPARSNEASRSQPPLEEPPSDSPVSGSPLSVPSSASQAVSEPPLARDLGRPTPQDSGEPVANPAKSSPPSPTAGARQSPGSRDTSADAKADVGGTSKPRKPSGSKSSSATKSSSGDSPPSDESTKAGASSPQPSLDPFTGLPLRTNR